MSLCKNTTKEAENQVEEEKIITYKGFDKDLKCRDYQYEIGKEYEAKGKINACENGFHACEAPLDCFRYYAPGRSRYCQVEQSGELSRDGEDTKVASRRIKIGAEIGIPGLVKAQIEYVKAHTTTEHTDPERATAGNYGAATSCGSASVGKNGIACVRGTVVKARGGMGAILVIGVEPSNSYDIQEWKAVVVDGDTVKVDTWYTLKDGELVEITDEAEE